MGGASLCPLPPFSPNIQFKTSVKFCTFEVRYIFVSFQQIILSNSQWQFYSFLGALSSGVDGFIVASVAIVLGG